MAEQKNEVQVTFGDLLNDKLVSVSDALPKDFNKTRFVQNCLAVINEKPELQKANKQQLMAGLLKGSYLGLDFMSKECYLISYGNTLSFQTDYKGEIKIAKRYSTRPIKDIYAKVIREGDLFEESIINGQPSINFKPLPLNNGKIMGVFAVVLYNDGGMEYEVMTTEDVNSVRNSYSKASNSKAWKDSFAEMAKKTVLRRLCKHIDTDFDTIEARTAWEDGADSNIVKDRPSAEIVDVFAGKKDEMIVDDIMEGEDAGDNT